MMSDVKSCTEIQYRNFFFPSEFTSEKSKVTLREFNFRILASLTFFSGLGPVHAASARPGPGYQSATLNLVVSLPERQA